MKSAQRWVFTQASISAPTCRWSTFYVVKSVWFKNKNTFTNKTSLGPPLGCICKCILRWMAWEQVRCGRLKRPDRRTTSKRFRTTGWSSSEKTIRAIWKDSTEKNSFVLLVLTWLFTFRKELKNLTQEIEDWEWHENRELESKVTQFPNFARFPKFGEISEIDNLNIINNMIFQNITRCIWNEMICQHCFLCMWIWPRLMMILTFDMFSLSAFVYSIICRVFGGNSSTWATGKPHLTLKATIARCISIFCISISCISISFISIFCISIFCISIFCISMFCISMFCISLWADHSNFLLHHGCFHIGARLRSVWGVAQQNKFRNWKEKIEKTCPQTEFGNWKKRKKWKKWHSIFMCLKTAWLKLKKYYDIFAGPTRKL